jgi:hypothetical protein
MQHCYPGADLSRICCSISSIRNGRLRRVKLRSGAGMRLRLMLGGMCLW